jgi:hypothetical protein
MGRERRGKGKGEEREGIPTASPQIWGPKMLRTAYDTRVSQIWIVLSQPPEMMMSGCAGLNFREKTRLAWPAVTSPCLNMDHT